MMKLVDLSHVLDERTPVFPGDEGTVLSQCRHLEEDKYTAYFLQTSLHTGTHVDMPLHMIEDSRMAADFVVGCFAGRGVLLDVRGEMRIEMKPAYRAMIREGDIVLLYTGFDQQYGEPRYFEAHPEVGEALGAFLLSRKIRMLGMDMPSPDRLPFAFHRALLAAGVFVLENLTNLGDLVGVDAFEVLALPLRIRAEASLVRAVARIAGNDEGLST